MLKDIVKSFRHSLIPKLIFLVGITLLIFISTWAYFNRPLSKVHIDIGEEV